MPDEEKTLVNNDPKAVLWWTVYKYTMDTYDEVGIDDCCDAADRAVDKVYPRDS